MNGQIVFAPNGQLVVAIDNDGVSTFEEAAAKITALKAALKQLGVPLVFTGEVEQHVHADPQGRLLAHSHH
jgi:isochorismate hydrolase